MRYVVVTILYTSMHYYYPFGGTLLAPIQVHFCSVLVEVHLHVFMKMGSFVHNEL